MKRGNLSLPFRPPGCELTLPVFLHLLEKCKLLRVVDHHELLQEPLDDLADCGRAADVELLDGIQRQIKRSSLVRHVGHVHLLEGVVDGLRPDPCWYGHRPAQFQVHFNEARVGAIFILG